MTQSGHRLSPDNDQNRALTCVTEWNESEPDKGYKLIECAGRCVDIPENPAAPKSARGRLGNYEKIPDESSKSWES